MSVSRPPHHVPAQTLPSASCPPCWGHLSRTVSHYGTVACVLAVYPPDSTDAERRIAEAHRWFTPLSLGGGVVAWVVLCAAGFPPLLAAMLLVAALLPIGIILSRRSRSIRRRVVTVSACRSGLSEDTAAERAQQLRLETLAHALGDAALACRQGVIGRDRFDRVWTAAYAQAAVIATGSAR
ncbi:DUF6611 family protein [Microbacterium sp. SY138]